MKETPILMCGEMVRATLEGRKTNTRRIVKPQPPADAYRPVNHPHRGIRFGRDDASFWPGPNKKYATNFLRCPYGQPGDRLWVRETWKPDPAFGYPPNTKASSLDQGTNILYAATLPKEHPKATLQRWRPSIFMPRWASRITLEITGVRVERVQDISERGALAEGMTGIVGGEDAYSNSDICLARPQFRMLWDRLNVRRGYGWEKNPWVWALTFKIVKGDK